MRRILLAVALTGAAFPAALPAGAAPAGTTYSVATAAAVPMYQCNDRTCGTTVIGYTYHGQGTCSSNCQGYPSDPIDVTLSFSVARTWPGDSCRMKTGTGTLDATWPTDPIAPTAHGTFSFRSKDRKAVPFSGEITSSTVSVLFPTDPTKGFVTYPSNPCTGGPATASITFYASG
jgi:hypothetical protein